jgi:hypothetical protein
LENNFNREPRENFLTRISRIAANSNALKALRKSARRWCVSTYAGITSHKINAFAHRMGEGGRRPDEGERRTGEGRGENFNHQVAEILSRSRKVRSQIPNKTKMVAVRKDRGKRPTANARPGRGRIGQPSRNWGFGNGGRFLPKTSTWF